MKLFADVIKSEPSAADAHATTALGNQPRRRYRTFSSFVSGGPKRPQDGPSTFGPVPVITATTKHRIDRRLARLEERNPGVTEKVREIMRNSFGYDVDTGIVKIYKRTASPFPYDPSFLGRLSKAQVPSFLRALTHPEELAKARVSLDELVAIQDRVSPKHVVASLANPSGKRPTVVKLDGTHYIADGHDRLSARLLAGKTHAKVWLHDVDAPVNPAALKKRDWSTPFRIEKVDPDKQQLFGWASVVTKNGRPVIDKQDDIIPVDELESAAYDFVLESREQGDMHARTKGVGRLIESCVFTAEKQKAMGVNLGMEGWWVGFSCDCKELWKDVKSGRKREFSIGGAAIPEKVAV